MAAALREASAESDVASYSEPGFSVAREARLPLLTAVNGDQEWLIRGDYWLFRDESLEVNLMSFGAPSVVERELVPISLWNAIVATVSWEGE